MTDDIKKEMTNIMIDSVNAMKNSLFPLQQALEKHDLDTADWLYYYMNTFSNFLGHFLTEVFNPEDRIKMADSLHKSILVYLEGNDGETYTRENQ
jgi:hypothetical protein